MRAHRIHQRLEARGVGGVLVAGEEIHAPLHGLVQGGRLLARRRAGAGRHALRIDRMTAAPAEGGDVHLHGRAVELDGALDGLGAHRHQAALVGGAQHEQVGGDGVAAQGQRQAARVHLLHVALAQGAHDGLDQRVAGELQIRVLREGARHDLLRVHDGAGGALARHGQGVAGRGHHQVAADQRIGPAGGHAHGGNRLRRGAEAHVRPHRAALLRQARHVQHAHALALQVRGHAQQRSDGDHARAAHAGDDEAVHALRQVGQLGIGQRRVQHLFARGHALLQLAAAHGDEAGAKALEAGEILVASRLVDGALAAEFRLHRHHGHAVGLGAAIAAALAHGLVDDQAHVGVGKLAALAPAALLGGAGLVVDQHAGTGHLAQLALHLVQRVAVVDGDARRPAGHAVVFTGLVRHHGDARHAFGMHLLGNAHGVQRAVVALAAGHGHGVVVEHLEGDVRLGRNGSADGQHAGVEVGAVAHVLEHVRALGKRRLAHPGHALGTHLGVAQRAAVHALRHPRAADACVAAAAFRDARGGVVRAARAEVEAARHDVHRAQHGLAPRQSVGHVQQRRVDLGQAVAQHLGDHGGVQRHLHAQQLGAALVLLADDLRGALLAVEDVLELRLQQRALFLDDDDLVQAQRELGDAAGLQRPDHADLVDHQTQRLRACLVDAEICQRLAHVEPALARGDDADARALAPPERHAVDAVGLREGLHRRQLVVDQAKFLRVRGVGQADVQTVRRHVRQRGQRKGRAGLVHLHRARGIGRVLDALHAHPAARVARQRPAVQAVLDQLRHAGGREDGHLRVHQRELALVAGGGRFAGVVVAHQHQHAAVPRAARQVAVAEGVARAVHARPLAVPDGEHAVEAPLPANLGHLAAPDGRGSQVLVHAGHEHHVVRLQVFARLDQLIVEGAQRRAPVAGDIAGGVEACRAVAALLHHGQAHQGLHAGQIDRALRGGVLVFQAHGPQAAADAQIAHPEYLLACNRLASPARAASRSLPRAGTSLYTKCRHL